MFSWKYVAYIQKTFSQELFRVTAAKPLKQQYQNLILGIEESE